MPNESVPVAGTSPASPGEPPSATGGRPLRPSRRREWGWYSLLVLPFIGTLWVPFYNHVEPRAGSIPFFYWYQFVWIGISAVLTAIVYFATRSER
jgi:Protein of unknown function (DUF3311)